MPRVFISYRKSDSADITGRLADALGLRLDAGDLFWDERSLEGGGPWPEELSEGVTRADVLLAVIGREWLSAKDASHRRRIDQKGDWVRAEIALALKLGKKVMPVLVGGAKMPEKADGLPRDISKLTERQAVQLRSGGAFDRDLDALAAEAGLAPAKVSTEGTLADRVGTSNLLGEILVNAYAVCAEDFVSFRNAVAKGRAEFDRKRLGLARWLTECVIANSEIPHASMLRERLRGEDEAERMVQVAALLSAAAHVFRTSIPRQTVLVSAHGGARYWASTVPADSVWNSFDLPRSHDEISDTLAGFHPGLTITPEQTAEGVEIRVHRAEPRLWRHLEARHPAVAVAPLTPHAVTVKDTAGGFLVDGCEAEAEQADHLRDLLRQCHDEGITLLVLPELRMTPGLEDVIRDFLEGQEVTPERGLLLTVAGSRHVAEGQGWVNRSEVFGHRGQPVWHQDKLAEFHMQNGRVEDIQIGKRQTALDSPQGRLTVAICAGFFHQRAQGVMQATGADVFLVPAMSPRVDDLERFAEELVRSHAGTFVANCGCVGTGAHRSFYRVPVKNSKLCRIEEGRPLLTWRFSDNLD